MCRDGLANLATLSVLLVPDEHMTDDDKSLFNEQFNNDLALLQHRQQHPIVPNAVSAEDCEACGNPIPLGRREAILGVQTCIECQNAIELREKRMV